MLLEYGECIDIPPQFNMITALVVAITACVGTTFMHLLLSPLFKILESRHTVGSDLKSFKKLSSVAVSPESLFEAKKAVLYRGEIFTSSMVSSSDMSNMCSSMIKTITSSSFHRRENELPSQLLKDSFDLLAYDLSMYYKASFEDDNIEEILINKWHRLHERYDEMLEGEKKEACIVPNLSCNNPADVIDDVAEDIGTTKEKDVAEDTVITKEKGATVEVIEMSDHPFKIEARPLGDDTSSALLSKESIIEGGNIFLENNLGMENSSGDDDTTQDRIRSKYEKKLAKLARKTEKRASKLLRFAESYHNL